MSSWDRSPNLLVVVTLDELVSSAQLSSDASNLEKLGVQVECIIVGVDPSARAW